MPFDASQQPLSPIETRVLSTLMEKARTVPDSYPLSLNTLLSGCNQKTTREPVMDISQADALEALETLRGATLVFENSGSRTARFEHNFQRAVGVPEQSAVLLGLLMLRGPQTAAELRLNAERWYRFADTSSVEAFLDELAERSADKGGPLVVLLARVPGAREQRWMHLMCGPVDLLAFGHPATGDRSAASAADTPQLSVRVAELEDQLAHLKSTVERLCAELGVPMSPP